MKKLFMFLFSLVFLYSCDSEDQISSLPLSESVQEENLDLKKQFAKALVKAMDQHQELRFFLKEEALKMFDNDYDVLYHMIKDHSFGNGSTFRELIAAQYDHIDDLNAIENQVPLLTIMIPELPEDSFSAQLWDTENQSPDVAIRLNRSDYIPVFNKEQEEYTIKGIPTFPIIVIKENERIVAGTNLEKNGVVTGAKFHSKDQLAFQFIDNAFDASKNKIEKRVMSIADTKVKSAYDIYRNADGWHRDYVYYNIEPNNTRGQFDYDYQEHITSFSMNGDAFNALQKIARIENLKEGTHDGNDGVSFRAVRKRGESAWTGGFFEFKVKTLVNAKNGIGDEIVTYFSVKPTDLFDITYKKVAFIYVVDKVEHKSVNLNLPIFNWDLNEYASSIKMEIEEVDLTVTTKIKDTRTVQFATNFNIADGILKKIGLKFGASRTETQVQSTEKTFTQGNDELGSVIINFADDIIIRRGALGGYLSREYSTGWFKISVEPKRVQGF